MAYQEIEENKDISVNFQKNTKILYVANKSTRTQEYVGNIEKSEINTVIEPATTTWCTTSITPIVLNQDIQTLTITIEKNPISKPRTCKISLINTDLSSDVYLNIIQEAAQIEYNYYVYNPTINTNNKFNVSDSYIIQLTNNYNNNPYNPFVHDNGWYKINTDPNGFRKLGGYDGDEYKVLPVFTSNQTRDDDYFNVNNVEFTGTMKYYLNDTTDDLGDKNISELFKLDKLVITQGNNNIEGFCVNMKTQIYNFPVNNNKTQNPNGEECYLKCKINNGDDSSTLDIRLNIIYPYDYPYIRVEFTNDITTGRNIFQNADYINKLSIIVTDYVVTDKTEFNNTDPNKFIKKIKFVNWENGDDVILNNWNKEDSLRIFTYNLTDVFNMSLEEIKQTFNGKTVYTYLIKYNNSNNASSNNINYENIVNFAPVFSLNISRRQISINSIQKLTPQFAY